ncbi:YIP1 family protein [Bacillus sp. FJAT-47783]|uniref:YIP1 family protein n=1 Tax=Bacillus sp. FJAT-47783 TaxID=2922712 RepID=UPI001FAC53BA|nr:YIP1 family protein [Bacillus sp. FJAT-47783]
MSALSLIFQTLLLNKESISKIVHSENYSKWATIFTLLVGVCYGLVFYTYIPADYIKFDSQLLQVFAFSFVLVLGIFMIFITRVGLSFLLWAGGRAFGGPGLLRVLNRLTSFAIVPIIIGFPAIISFSTGSNTSVFMYILLIISLVWIYLILVKVIEVSQNLKAWKAYSATLIALVFFTSVYYLVLPPGS